MNIMNILGLYGVFLKSEKMYSREEAKALREEFWERFRRYSSGRRIKERKPGNWLMDHTGVRALNLRFHVDRKVAQVCIDVETRNMDKRLELYEKLESVRKPLESAMGEPMTWELEYIRENGKSVSRVYTEMEGADIYNRDTWAEAHRFMYNKMSRLEEFYLEYRDFFKYG
jgi:hypothetical protein